MYILCIFYIYFMWVCRRALLFRPLLLPRPQADQFPAQVWEPERGPVHGLAGGVVSDTVRSVPCVVFQAFAAFIWAYLRLF
jgi:hypothetical protein